jgi:hypothetical protein
VGFVVRNWSRRSFADGSSRRATVVLMDPTDRITQFSNVPVWMLSIDGLLIQLTLLLAVVDEFLFGRMTGGMRDWELREARTASKFPQLGPPVRWARSFVPARCALLCVRS